MRVISVVLALVTVTCVISNPASSAVVRALDIDSMIKASSLVVQGTVKGLESRRSNPTDNWRIVTDVRIHVEATLLGDSTSDDITVTIPGGVIADEGQAVFGAPKPVTGETAVFFLAIRKNSKTYSIVGFSQGFLPVYQEGDGLLWVEPQTRNVRVIGKATPLQKMPLDELVQRIRRINGSAAEVAR